MTTHSYTQYLLFLTTYTALNRSITVLMYQYIECIPNAYNDFCAYSLFTSIF